MVRFGTCGDPDPGWYNRETGEWDKDEPDTTMVSVNDGEQWSGRCWICNLEGDHKGKPHGVATGDGVTRYDIVALMNQGGYTWR